MTCICEIGLGLIDTKRLNTQKSSHTGTGNWKSSADCLYFGFANVGQLKANNMHYNRITNRSDEKSQ